MKTPVYHLTFVYFVIRKVLSVDGQTKLDTNRVTLSSIQKGMQHAREEQRVVAKLETPPTIKQSEGYSAVKTPGK